MKLFFTGGTGFFGRAVLRYLQAQHALNLSGLPEEVVVLSRSSERFLDQYNEFSDISWLRFHKGDIEDFSSLPQREKFTHVLHAAADSTEGAHLSPLQRYDQIVNGTRNLLDFAVASDADRFLYTSSGAVYGPQPAHLDRIPEDWNGIPDPLNAGDSYGIAKRSAEHLCVLYGSQFGISTIIARCFAFVGQDLPLDAHFAIGNFIRDALWSNEIIVNGDGTPQRSYLDQEDLANWLFTLLEKGVSGQAYNVGSDQSLTITELAHLVRDIVAPNKQVRILGDLIVNKNRNIYVPNINRVRTELNLDVRISLEDSIRKVALIASLRINREGM